MEHMTVQQTKTDRHTPRDMTKPYLEEANIRLDDVSVHFLIRDIPNEGHPMVLQVYTNAHKDVTAGNLHLKTPAVRWLYRGWEAFHGIHGNILSGGVVGHGGTEVNSPTRRRGDVKRAKRQARIPNDL